MPAKKKTAKKRPSSSKRTSDNITLCASCGVLGKKLLWTLAGIALVYVIVLLGTMIRNNIERYEHIGQADRQERTIRVEGQGTVTVKPDVAMTTMGVTTEAETVTDAQDQNTQIMNNLLSGLRQLGISEDDIQTTNYNVYPRYDYLDEEGRVLRGYEVSQNVSVKIRDLESANQVIALAGQVGATNVSGLQFTIDDTDVYREEARKEALDKAYAKAEALSEDLGVRIIGLVSYDEFASNVPKPYVSRSYAFDEMGFGGGTAPELEAGSEEVEVTVSMIFEIVQ